MGIQVEEIRDGDLVWIDNIIPSPREWVYARLESGQIVLAWHDGAVWIVDGFRTPYGYQPITHWAEIRYPEGPRRIV